MPGLNQDELYPVSCLDNRKSNSAGHGHPAKSEERVIESRYAVLIEKFNIYPSHNVEAKCALPAIDE